MFHDVIAPLLWLLLWAYMLIGHRLGTWNPRAVVRQMIYGTTDPQTPAAIAADLSRARKQLVKIRRDVELLEAREQAIGVNRQLPANAASGKETS